MLRKFLIAGTGAVALAFPASALGAVPDPGAIQANIAAQVSVQVAEVKQKGAAISAASADANAQGGNGGSADGGISAGGVANSGAVGGTAGAAAGGDSNQTANANGGGWARKRER